MQSSTFKKVPLEQCVSNDLIYGDFKVGNSKDAKLHSMPALDVVTQTTIT